MWICTQCLRRFEAPEKRCPDDAAQLLELEESADPRVGTVAAGRFLIVGFLGAGGMSTLYKACQLSIPRLVALKLLSGPDSKDQEFVERFIREARGIAQLTSPNTIKLYDFGKLESGELFIAMELVAGRSLETILVEEAPLDPERTKRLVDQIAASLEDAHAQGLVHRDIKPSNVMVERLPDGREHVKVLDFGLVKNVSEGPDRPDPLTERGTFNGTPAYMAPELWSDRFGPISPAVDLYALGVLTFQLLSGKRPLNANSIPMFIQQHLYAPPAALSSYRPIDPAVLPLDRMIGRCLMKRPEERYLSVRDLRRELAVVDSIAPPNAPEGDPSTGLAATLIKQRVTEPPPLVKPPRRSRAFAAALLAGLPMLAVGWALSRESDDAPAAAQRWVAPAAARSSTRAAVRRSLEAPRPTTTATATAMATPSPAMAEPKAPHPATVRGKGPRLSSLKVSGALPAEAAESAIAPHHDALLRCYRLQGGGAPLSFTLVVVPEGRLSSFKLGPEDDPRAKPYRACIEPTMNALRFPAFTGSLFATVSGEVSAP